jgi:hypothetical protein
VQRERELSDVCELMAAIRRDVLVGACGCMPSVQQVALGMESRRIEGREEGEGTEEAGKSREERNAGDAGDASKDLTTGIQIADIRYAEQEPSIYQPCEAFDEEV